MANRAKDKADKKIKLTVKCTVKGVSSGKNKVSLGISIDRDQLDVIDADHLLTGASVDIELIPAKDVAGQKEMFDEKHAHDFTAECSGISVHTTYISASLKIDKADADLNKLDEFSFKVAKAVMSRTGDAKSDDDDDDSEAEGQLKLAGATA